MKIGLVRKKFHGEMGSLIIEWIDHSPMLTNRWETIGKDEEKIFILLPRLDSIYKMELNNVWILSTHIYSCDPWMIIFIWNNHDCGNGKFVVREGNDAITANRAIELK